MPFGVVSGVGLVMGALDFGGDHRREGAFWGEFAATHCNQWGLCCVVAWRGLFLAWFLAFFENTAPLISVATWRTDHGTGRFSTRV